MMTVIEFEVIGDPATKGSTRSFVRGGRVVTTNMCKKEKPWAERVHWTAKDIAPPDVPWCGPIGVHLRFFMPRPGRLGKLRTNVMSDKRPDVDKLVRSVLDALTGVFFVDDGQISTVVANKYYADFGAPSRVRICICRLEVKDVQV